MPSAILHNADREDGMAAIRFADQDGAVEPRLLRSTVDLLDDRFGRLRCASGRECQSNHG